MSRLFSVTRNSEISIRSMGRTFAQDSSNASKVYGLRHGIARCPGADSVLMRKFEGKEIHLKNSMRSMEIFFFTGKGWVDHNFEQMLLQTFFDVQFFGGREMIQFFQRFSNF